MRVRPSCLRRKTRASGSPSCWTCRRQANFRDRRDETAGLRSDFFRRQAADQRHDKDMAKNRTANARRPVFRVELYYRSALSDRSIGSSSDVMRGESSFPVPLEGRIGGKGEAGTRRQSLFDCHHSSGDLLTHFRLDGQSVPSRCRWSQMTMEWSTRWGVPMALINGEAALFQGGSGKKGIEKSAGTNWHRGLPVVPRRRSWA